MKSRVLFGVFLVALTGLMFEVLLTKVFSTLLWYHYAFVAISSALLGWGLGALILTFFPRRSSLLGTFATLFSLSILLFLYIVIRVPAVETSLVIYFPFSILPFIFGGMCLSLVFDIHGKESGRLYFYDLFGASLGALSVPILLSIINPESLLIITATIPLLGAIFLSRKSAWLPGVLIIVLLGVFFFNLTTNAITLPIGPTKALAQHLEADSGLEIVDTEWNSFSRVDLVEGFDDGFLANNYIDTFAWTYIIPWDYYSMNYTHKWFRYLPFHAKPKPSVVIIGSGGGTDVSLELASGSENVTAVEINPSIVANVRRYGAEAGNIYDHKYVDVNIDEGRNFVARSKDTYDMVLLGFVDSSTALASGGLVMSENYLYTVEAFEDYMAHLEDDGVLAFIRYEIDIPRLLTMADEALGPDADVSKHVMVISETDPERIEEFLGNQMVFLIKKTPFTIEEATKMNNIVQEWGLSAVMMPHYNVDEPYRQYLSGSMGKQEFASQFDINVHPTHDNNPFYFAYYKPIGIPMSYLLLLAVPLLISLILFLAVLVAKWLKDRRLGLRPSWILYFAGLGVGFMMMEIPILQKFILLLGRPIYTFSVILFSLLLSTSLGSMASSYIKTRRLPNAIMYSSIAAILITAFYLFALDYIVRILLPFSLVTRIIMTFVLLLPIGFFIGIPFPSGIRLLKQQGQDVPLAWGVNGVTSVFGSIAATVLGVAIGFSIALQMAVVSYLVVIVSILAVRRMQ